jgi:hypothetical protein
MRKTLLLFTTTALALLLAAGMAWAALPAPTVVSTVPPNGATGVVRTADITAQFAEAMSTKSFQILNHSTFYWLVQDLLPPARQLHRPEAK